MSFSGVICHVFDAHHPARAVAMRGTAAMPHHASLHVPQASIASADVALTCDGSDCVLDLTDTALRFPGSGRARAAAGGSFDTIVPHLSRVTNGELRAVRGEVFDEVPSPASVISASFELPAGSLTATPLDGTAHYEPDFEHRGDRTFAREVFLDGVVAAPRLLVRRFGERAWHAITFKADSLIELRMVNEPSGGMAGMPHELLFYDLSALPLTAKPLITASSTTAGGLQPRRGADYECSGTQLP